MSLVERVIVGAAVGGLDGEFDVIFTAEVSRGGDISGGAGEGSADSSPFTPVDPEVLDRFLITMGNRVSSKVRPSLPTRFIPELLSSSELHSSAAMIVPANAEE